LIGAAAGDRERLADDGVAAVKTVFLAEEVHRPAAAVRGAGLLAEELGHHRLRIEPLGEGVAVFAVGAVDIVGRPQC